MRSARSVRSSRCGTDAQLHVDLLDRARRSPACLSGVDGCLPAQLVYMSGYTASVTGVCSQALVLIAQDRDCRSQNSTLDERCGCASYGLLSTLSSTGNGGRERDRGSRRPEDPSSSSSRNGAPTARPLASDPAFYAKARPGPQLGEIGRAFRARFLRLVSAREPLKWSGRGRRSVCQRAALRRRRAPSRPTCELPGGQERFERDGAGAGGASESGQPEHVLDRLQDGVVVGR